MRFASAVLVAVFAGCAAPIQLTDAKIKLIDSKGVAHPGEYNPMSQTVTATVDGKVFTGHYITNQSAGFYQGSGVAFSGGHVGSSVTTGTSYNAGDSGRAILTAQDGGVLTCGFNYDAVKVIGTCHSNTGERYHLVSQ